MPSYSDKVQFKNLALAIIDEQHRFGVAQRLALRRQDDPDCQGRSTGSR